MTLLQSNLWANIKGILNHDILIFYNFDATLLWIIDSVLWPILIQCDNPNKFHEKCLAKPYLNMRINI